MLCSSSNASVPLTNHLQNATHAWANKQLQVCCGDSDITASHPCTLLYTAACCRRCRVLQLVAPPCQHVSGTVELLTLSPCRQLTCLEVLTSSRLYVPFTLKTVSLATLAWPHLAALRLSLAGACAGLQFDLI